MALTAIKSTGEFYEYDIRPLYEINKESYERIDLLRAIRERKIKGSRSYKRLTAQIKNLYAKIRTRTKQYLHALAKLILSDHPDVVEFKIGNWKKNSTLANTGNKHVDKKINRAVQNHHPLQMLISYLSYKALLRGQEVKKIDERGTTRSCSACGYVVEKGLKPSVRTFKCPSCNFTFPRDHNACINLMKKDNSALWTSLSGNLPDRTVRRTLHPFSFKPQHSKQVIAIS